MEPKVEQRCSRRGGLGSNIPCGDFTNEDESINAGLVLYDYYLHAEKTKSSQNVLTLPNRKDVKLSPCNTQRSFENCIKTCPRCMNIYKRAKRLLKNISTLGKRKTLGVCSHCGIIIQTDPSHCKCNVIFKKFLNSSAKDLYIDEHNIKTCLSKPHRFKTGFLKNEAGSSRLKLHTHLYSDSYLNRASKKYYGQKSSQKPTDGSRVKIRPLFQSGIDLSKLYITPTCHSFLQEQKALGFRKTRLRIRKQPHDQTFQFHFIFPSEKKDLASRLQVSSSQLLHDIEANRKTNIHEKKNLSAKTNKQTLPWQRDFSISSLQGKSIEFLYEIYANYKEIKTLKDKILEERCSRGLENKNLGAKKNKQSLPWQSDFSLLSLEGKALELLHDIRAKYKETKILEDKILDLGKKNLGAKSDKRILPWERNFSLLGLEGNSLELLQYMRGKYRKTKMLENKILAERRSSDLEMKNLGAKTNEITLPWQNNSSLLGLEGESLKLLHNIRGNNRKTKIPENKNLAERRGSDLHMKNLGAKTNKGTLPWQNDSSLLGLEGESLELLQNIEGKYRKTKILENKKNAERRDSDHEMKNLGLKTNKQVLPWPRDLSLLGLEGNSLEILHDIRGKYRKTKILENKILAEQRSSDLEMKNLGAKINKRTLPWRNDSSILGLEGESLELLHNIREKYRKTKILENKILAERRSSDLEMKNFGAKTNKRTLPWQTDSSLLSLKENSLELLNNIQAKYKNKKRQLELIRDLEKKSLGTKTKKPSVEYVPEYEEKKRQLEKQRITDLENNKLVKKTKKHKESSLLNLEVKYEEKERHLEEQRNSNLEKYTLEAKTKNRGLPWQKESSLVNLETKYKEKEKHSEEQRNRVLEKKMPGAKTKKNGLPWQKDSSLVNLETKYEEKEKHSEEQRHRDLEKKMPGAKTKKNGLPWQKDSSLVNLETKYEEKEKHSEEQRNRDLEKKMPGAKTKKNGLPWQKDSSLVNLETKYEEKGKHSEEQRNRDLEKKMPGAKTKKNGLPWQNDSSLVSLETKYEEKEKHSEEQRNRVEKKMPGAKTKKHELPRQDNYSLLKLEKKHEEKQKHSDEQRNRDLDTKKYGAKTKDNGLPSQKNSSHLYLEEKYEKKERHLEKQHSKDLEKKKLGVKTKKHGLPWQKYSSLLSIEGKSEKKKKRLENQLSRDFERTESKNLGAITKKYKLPWPKKDSALLNLEEATATITQANVIIDDQTKIRHKKKLGLNKKEDSFNELAHSNSEINGGLVRKTSKEIEERRKKNEAILEMLTRPRMDSKIISGIKMTKSHGRFLSTDSTALHTETAERKMNVYGMVLSRPEFDWFAKNKVKREIFYETGERFAEFSEDGCSRWFYKDGKLALDYYNTEKTPPGRRYVVYSIGKHDRTGRPRPQTILASFDHSGNAVVFDHAGNIRLKYDQNEGVLLDHSIGPESHWKWHSLNGPPATTHTEVPFIDRVHKLELKKSVLEKSKKNTQSYKQFEIKMKALKINKLFSLKILDQAKVYLIYRDDTIHIKLNIGMMLNRMEKVDIVTCHVDDVFNPLEKFPADTQSVEELQQMVAQARHAKRARMRRRGRLMRPAFVF